MPDQRLTIIQEYEIRIYNNEGTVRTATISGLKTKSEVKRIISHFNDRPETYYTFEVVERWSRFAIQEGHLWSVESDVTYLEPEDFI